MPRRRNRQRRRPRSRRSNDVVRIPVTAISTATLAAGATNFGVQPAAFTQSSAVADVYEFYRLVSLRYRLHPANTITASQAMVYMPGVVDNATSMSVTAITQSQHHAYLATRATVPTSWVKVPRAALKSFGDWYKALVGTPDTSEEIQGTIFLAGTGTESITYEVKAVYEFKNPINSAATPAMKAAAEQERERKRLLKLLGFDQTPAAFLPGSKTSLLRPPPAM